MQLQNTPTQRIKIPTDTAVIPDRLVQVLSIMINNEPIVARVISADDRSVTVDGAAIGVGIITVARRSVRPVTQGQ